MTKITPLFVLCMLLGISSFAQTGPRYNYGEALQKSIFFYECQRAGNLNNPRYKPNRVTWRANSCMDDGKDNNLDLTGGWFDAGDHVKFGFPLAGSVTLLAWGGIEYKAAYKQAGQWDELLDNMRWVNDYLIKCHPSPNVFYGQVGEGNPDHGVWAAAEVTTVRLPNRPSFKITASTGGSDLAGETAAAMAASSLLFADDDPAYSATLLRHAKELYSLAEVKKARYTDAIPDAIDFYRSWSGYNDELVWGAAWLYMATNDAAYLNKAETYYDNLNTEPQVPVRSYKWGLAWDDKAYGCYVLLSKITGKAKYKEDAERSLDFWTTGYNGQRVPYTAGGLAQLTQWGSLRHTANTSFLAFIYSDLLSASNPKKAIYYNFAVRQINYTLGDNPSNRSYMCGFGNNPPIRPHHRTGHAGWENNVSGLPVNNRHILYGALVGGPGSGDAYEDDRSNFQQNEVACDFNAAYTGTLARMYRDFGGAPLANFPIAETPVDELFIDTQISSAGANYVEPGFNVYNHTAWPARVTPNITFRYFINISEGLAAGFRLADYQVVIGHTDGPTTATQLKPWDQANNIYYFEVAYPGAKLYPGGQSESRKEAKVRVKLPDGSPATAWNNANDWSYQPGAGYARNPKVTMYDNGVLVFGQEPPRDTPTAVIGVTPTNAQGPAPFTVNFSGAASTDPTGSALTYAWDFGDNTAGTGKTVAHTYRAVGMYTAKLTVTNAAGKSGTATQKITVLSGDPTAVISTTPTPPRGRLPFRVNFSGAGSTDPNSDVLTYRWNFGDTSPVATGVTVSHIYTVKGTYTATLTVTDTNGGSDSETISVIVDDTMTVNNPPTAAFTPSVTSGFAPLAVGFDASASSDPDGDVLTYAWNFGNGSTGTGKLVTHTYTLAGKYTVTLTVSDGRLSHTATTTITVEKLDCNLLTRFGVPRATALPSTSHTAFDNIYILGNAPAGLLSNAYKPVINWDLPNRGLYQLSVNTRNGQPNWYVDLRNAATHTLGSPQPKVTLTGSGFPGLDGSYYINTDANGLALVETTGKYAIYWTNSSTPPAGCPAARVINIANAGSQEVLALPNPTTGVVRINGIGSDYKLVTVYDMTGKVQLRVSVKVDNGAVDLDMSQLRSGIYYLKASGNTLSKTLRIVKQ